MSFRQSEGDACDNRSFGVATTGERVAFVAIKHWERTKEFNKRHLPFIHLSPSLPLVPRLNSVPTGPGARVTPPPPGPMHYPNFCRVLTEDVKKQIDAAKEFVATFRQFVHCQGPNARVRKAEDWRAIIGAPPEGLRTLLRLLAVPESNAFGLDFSGYRDFETPPGFVKEGPLGAGAFGTAVLLRDADGALYAGKTVSKD